MSTENNLTRIHDLIAESHDDLVRLSEEHKDLPLEPAIRHLREAMAQTHIVHDAEAFRRLHMSKLSADSRAARMWNPDPVKTFRDMEDWKKVPEGTKKKLSRLFTS